MIEWLLGEEHDRQVELAETEIARAVPVDSPGRMETWDKCWETVLEQFRAGNPDLVPPYLRQTTSRIGGCYARVSVDFFPAFQRSLVTALAKKYFKHEVFEIGCGGGFNLRTLANFKVSGCDRSASAGRAAFAAGLQVSWCGDLRDDCALVHLPKGAGILTCGFMEQLGKCWGAVFDKLVEHDGVIVHIEPFEELYGADELDALALRYHRARGYLSGYLTHLREDRRVRILEERRIRIGSAWNDGFSCVVWRGDG